MSGFGDWTMAQVAAHNARVQKENRIPVPDSAVDDEGDLHEDIIKECRRLGWIFFHGAMSERTHRTRGEPDFIILANGGRTFLIECKSTKGKLRSEQAAMVHWAKNLGHTIHVVRSMEEFFTVTTKPKEQNA